MELRAGMRVATPDGAGVVKNFLVVEGRRVAVFVSLDAHRNSTPEFPESQWRTYSPRVVRVLA